MNSFTELLKHAVGALRANSNNPDENREPQVELPDQVAKTITPPPSEDRVANALPSNDCRKWYEKQRTPIRSDYQVEKNSIPLPYSLTIYSHLSQSDFRLLSQAIFEIHGGETMHISAFYRIRVSDILRLLDPNSIVLIATTLNSSGQEESIGYGILSQTTKSECREVGVMIKEEYRGLGIAHNMFQTILANASELAVDSCFVSFYTGNRPVWKLLSAARDAGLITYECDTHGSDTQVRLHIVQKTARL